MLTKKKQNLIDLVHSQGLLTLLHLTDKTKPYTSPFRKLYLRKSVFFSFCLYIF